MILDDMGPDGIRNELNKDLREIIFQVNKYRITKLNPDYRNGKINFPTTYTSKFVSKNKNLFLLFFELRSEIDIYSPKYRFICVYDTEYGKKAIMQTNKRDDHDNILEFGPHFFQRYSERAGVNKKGIDLIKHFFVKNLTFIFQKDYERDKNHPNAVMYLCDEGACFGDYYGQYSAELKTFLHNSNMDVGYKSKMNSQYNELLDRLTTNYYMDKYHSKREDESNN